MIAATAATVAPPTRRRPRVNLTHLIANSSTVTQRADALLTGWEQSTRGEAYRAARSASIAHRVRRGFAERSADMLTPPAANTKLAKGATPSYGLTIQSHAMTLSDGTRVNGCPWAGLCVTVCVLNRGHGQRSSVQSARDWRTDFLALDPLAALTMIGAELRRGVMKHGKILFRPNVNSDLIWRDIVGDALRGLDGVTSYGYSKRPIGGDAIGADWERLHGLDHVAYSASEKSNGRSIDRHLAAGGTVAVVTDRRPHEPIAQWHTVGTVVDADTTDEWLIGAPSTIGDLSYKTDRPQDAPRFVQKVGYRNT